MAQFTSLRWPGLAAASSGLRLANAGARGRYGRSAIRRRMLAAIRLGLERLRAGCGIARLVARAAIFLLLRASADTSPVYRLYASGNRASKPRAGGCSSPVSRDGSMLQSPASATTSSSLGYTWRDSS